MQKFGNLLVSRPAGKEAWLAFQPVLREAKSDEKITVDFEGVQVLTPSWADEFLTPLKVNFEGRVELMNTDNATVQATLKTLSSLS